MSFSANRVNQYECPHCHQSVDVSELKPLATRPCAHCGKDIDIPAAFGQHHLFKITGSDHLGTTFKAFDNVLHREVALKVLHGQGGDEQSEKQRTDQFIEDARNLAVLDNDNVIKIYSIGKFMDQPFIEMELLTGGSADRYLMQSHRLSEIDVLSFGLLIAGGLKAAHQKGLMHLNVCPSSILIDANSERPKLVDFGTASDHGDRSKRPYQAPEQLQPDKPLDWRVDQYGLGATLFHMLTGKPPFNGASAAKQSSMASRFSEVNTQVHHLTEQVISRLLATKPEDRYESYDALITDLTIATDTLLEDETLAESTAESSSIIALAQVMKGEETQQLQDQAHQRALQRTHETADTTADATKVLEPKALATPLEGEAYLPDDPLIDRPTNQRSGKLVMMIGAAGGIIAAAILFAFTQARQGPTSQQQTAPLSSNSIIYQQKGDPPATSPQPVAPNLQTASMTYSDDKPVTIDTGSDITIEDFEGEHLKAWFIDGAAFQEGLRQDGKYEGIQGKSYLSSGGSTIQNVKLVGHTRSPTFVANRAYLNFVMSKVTTTGFVVALVDENDNRVRATRTHPDPTIGEELRPVTWDLSDLQGQPFHILIKDATEDALIAVDDFVLSNTPFTTASKAVEEAIKPGPQPVSEAPQVINKFHKPVKAIRRIYVEHEGMVVMEAEAPTNATEPEKMEWISSPVIKDHSGSSYVFANVDGKAKGANCQYQIDFSTQGSYHIWIRGMAGSRSDDTIYHLSNENLKVFSIQDDKKWTWYTNDDRVEIPKPGTYTFTIYPREKGVRVDKIILTLDEKFKIEGHGHKVSPTRGEKDEPKFDLALVTAKTVAEAPAQSDKSESSSDSVLKATPVQDEYADKFAPIKTYSFLDGKAYQLSYSEGRVLAASRAPRALQNFTLETVLTTSKLSALLLHINNDTNNRRKFLIKEIKASIVDVSGASQQLTFSDVSANYSPRSFAAESILKGRPGWANDGQTQSDQYLALYLDKPAVIQPDSRLRIEMINGFPPTTFKWSITGHDDPKPLAKKIIDAHKLEVPKKTTFAKAVAPTRYEPGLIKYVFNNSNGFPKSDAVPATSKIVNKMSLSATKRMSNYAIRWEGYLFIKREGKYAINMKSDDDTRLYLHDKLISESYYPKAAPTKELNFKRGYHKFTLLYYQGRGSASLDLTWKSPANPKDHAIPADQFFYTPQMAAKLKTSLKSKSKPK